jgi:hypothetical protein
MNPGAILDVRIVEFERRGRSAQLVATWLTTRLALREVRTQLAPVGEGGFLPLAIIQSA